MAPTEIPIAIEVEEDVSDEEEEAVCVDVGAVVVGVVEVMGETVVMLFSK